MRESNQRVTSYWPNSFRSEFFFPGGVGGGVMVSFHPPAIVMVMVKSQVVVEGRTEEAPLCSGW